MRVNSSKAPNVSGCVDFLHSGDSDLSVQDVQSACIQEGETFVSACPAVNIDAICKLSVQGKQIEMIIYNDTNSEDLSSFGSACANKGGQYNP